MKILNLKLSTQLENFIVKGNPKALCSTISHSFNKKFYILNYSSLARNLAKDV